MTTTEPTTTAWFDLEALCPKAIRDEMRSLATQMRREEVKG